MTETQAPPYVVKIEPTEGCNLRCAFCGISSIRGPGKQGDRSGPYKFMAPGVAHLLGSQMADAGWNSRIEFAMHGEPTLNEELPAIIFELRSWLPKANIMLTTNALPLVDRGFERSAMELFGMGLNTMAIDNYPPHRAAEAARVADLPGVEVVEYPSDPAGNPHRRRKRSEPPLLSIMESIASATEGTHSKLNNGAGMASAPLEAPVMKRCTRPFREFAVRWDGSIALCCNDWRGEYKISSILDESCAAIWQRSELVAARRLLYASDRDFGVCRGCDDFGGYRPGLLPDASGQHTLPAPTDVDRAVAQRAMRGDPFTAPVERKWETAISLSRKPGATPSRGAREAAQ